MLQGRVVKGRGEARKIGYPTANIVSEAPHNLLPGIWAGFVDINGKKYNALFVVGMWKEANGFLSLEAHVLNWTEDLYDKIIQLEPLEYLRELQSFSTVSALIEQIQHDITLAKLCFQALSKEQAESSRTNDTEISSD